MANVKDVTTIADEAKRAHAEKVNILCGKDYIMNRTASRPAPISSPPSSDAR